MGYRTRHKRAKPLSRLSWILNGLFLDFALDWQSAACAPGSLAANDELIANSERSGRPRNYRAAC